MAKVIFVQNIWCEYYGVMLLSAMLKKHGHKTKLAIGTKKEIVKQVKKYSPDAIAFSVMHMEKDFVEETAKELKKISSAPILVGGSIAFSNQDIIKNKFVDVLATIEGEEAILDIVNKIEEKKDFSKVPNIITYKNGKLIKNDDIRLVENLNTLPFPDRSIYKENNFFLKNTRYELFRGSRGCPYSCTFCFYNFIKSEYNYPSTIRHRAPKNLIEEIRTVRKKYNIKRVHFTDSIFTSKRKWLMKFLEQYKEVKLPFSCNGHFNYLDEEIIKKMKEANCASVQIGLESGDNDYRNKVLDKHVVDKTILEKSILLRKYKLPFLSLNMMALPGETFKQAMKTITLNQKIKPNYTIVDLLMPYPNLDLTDYAIENNYLMEEQLDLLSKGKYKVMRSVLKQTDIKKISNLQKFAIVLIHYPFLEPIILQLIRLPENKIFDWIFGASIYMEMKRQFKFSILKIFEDGIKNFKAFN